MLQSIRDRLTGPFVWLIVGIIVVPFAFFGIETLRSGGGDPTVVKVGDQKITQSQFRAGYEQRLQQLQRLMGESFRQDLIDNERFRQGVLDDMVQESLMRQHVRDAGYRASDALLFETLRSIPAFQDDGAFSTELYRSRLATQGYTPARFEQQLRDSLVMEQLRQGVLDSALVVPTAAAQAYRLGQQQRWLAYATFSAARYLPQVSVDAAQVQARYEEQKARFMSDERIKIAYVELSLDALPEAPKPDPEVLRVIYEADKATRFSTIEERKARHILVNFGADKDRAKKKIEALADTVAKGADFSSLAGSQSDDPGSKGKGGDLGWVRRGQMLETFEKALFGLKKGEVSGPVETEFGWHLIRLEDVREATTRPFEEPGVQAELLKIYRQRDAERRFQEQSEKLEQVAFESAAALDPAAEAIGAKVQVSDWVTRQTGAGIAGLPTVREAAFSEDVLGGENSRPVQAGPNRIVVLRKQEHEPARQKALDEVAGTIREELRAEAARARAEAAAEEAMKAMNEGASLEQVAGRAGAELKAPGLVTRSAEGVDPRVIDALFKLPRPEPGKASTAKLVLPGGDAVLLATTAIQDADWTTAAEADRSREVGQLREALAGAEFDAYRAELEREIEVKRIAAPVVDPAS